MCPGFPLDTRRRHAGYSALIIGNPGGSRWVARGCGADGNAHMRNAAPKGKFLSPTEDDQRLTVEAKRKTQVYTDQSAALARFIRMRGLTLSVI